MCLFLASLLCFAFCFLESSHFLIVAGRPAGLARLAANCRRPASSSLPYPVGSSSHSHTHVCSCTAQSGVFKLHSWDRKWKKKTAQKRGAPIWTAVSESNYKTAQKNCFAKRELKGLGREAAEASQFTRTSSDAAAAGLAGPCCPGKWTDASAWIGGIGIDWVKGRKRNGGCWVTRHSVPDPAALPWFSTASLSLPFACIPPCFYGYTLPSFPSFQSGWILL